MSVIDKQERSRIAATLPARVRLLPDGGRLWLIGVSAAVCIAFAVMSDAPWWLSAVAFLALSLTIFVTSVPSSDSRHRADFSANNLRRDLDHRSALLIAALPDPCVVVNRRGVVVMHNEQAASAIVGLRMGEPLSFVLRVPAVTEALRLVLAGGRSPAVHFGERVPIERSFEAFVEPIHVNPSSAGSIPDYVLIILHDETKRQRLETMRVDFIANASHELRTPLASLLGFIETLQGPARNDTPARDRFLGIMRQQALRMSRLIDDLLSLSHIELNAHVRPQAVIDVSSVVAQTVDALSPLANDNQSRLQLTCEGAPFAIRAERDEIYRVFENLIENAIKYGGDGQTVRIIIDREPAQDGFAAAGRVSVVDQGPGIAPEHLPRLTERFYRVDTQTSRAKGGTGLGLAIVKHILARHRARLTINSTLAEGSTFCVRFDEVFQGDASCHPIVKEGS